MINLKEVLEIYKHKEIKEISKSQYREMWQVRKHLVAMQMKRGRWIITCDCKNHSRFCGSSKPNSTTNQYSSNNGVAICIHKEAVIAYPAIKAIQSEIDKKIENLKAINYGENNDIVNTLIFEMEDLSKLLWVRKLK